MRTIQKNIYQFSELSEEAKEKAVRKLFYINVDHNWWGGTYDDAENIGLKITSFGLDRNRHANGEFIKSAPEVALLVCSEHGKDCDTYKTAAAFLSEYDSLVEKYSDGINKNVVSEGNEYEFDKEADELETEFLSNLLEDYATILEREYEYLTSEKAIIETIEANGYEFTEDGKLI